MATVKSGVIGATSGAVKLPPTTATTTTTEEDKLLEYSGTTGQVKVDMELPTSPYNTTSLVENVTTVVKEYVTKELLNDIEIVEDDDDNPITE